RNTSGPTPALLPRRTGAGPDREAFRYPQGPGWASLTWKQAGERIRRIASGLLALGLKAEERCAILAGTRVDWILADMGILCAGGATTTIYPSTTAEDCVYILTDSASRFVFAENDAQVAKLASRRADLPGVAAVIRLDDAGDAHGGWVMSLADVEARGDAHAAQNPGAFDTAVRGVKSGSLATLIYTSGTTGKPKGVELVHDCWAYEAEAVDALHIL